MCGNSSSSFGGNFQCCVFVSLNTVILSPLGKRVTARSSWRAYLLDFFLVQVAKVEDQGTMTGEKRKLSRRELEEELQNLQRMNHKFYKFAVEELVKEVYQSSGGDSS